MTQLVTQQHNDLMSADPLNHFTPQEGINAMTTMAQPIILRLARLHQDITDPSACFNEILEAFEQLEAQLYKKNHSLDLKKKMLNIMLMSMDNAMTAAGFHQSVEDYKTKTQALWKRLALKKRGNLYQIAESLNKRQDDELALIELIYLCAKLGWQRKSQRTTLPTTLKAANDQMADLILNEKHDFRRNLYISPLPSTKKSSTQKVSFSLRTFLGTFCIIGLFAYVSMTLLDYSLKPLQYQLQTIEQKLP